VTGSAGYLKGQLITGGAGYYKGFRKVRVITGGCKLLLYCKGTGCDRECRLS
jgi:hypothetical protein